LPYLLLYSDAIHKLGMADNGPGMLTVSRLPATCYLLPAHSGADLPKCCSTVRS